MEQMYPDQFNEDGTCKFQFSNGWRANWMSRYNFSYRRTTTKKKKNLSSRDTVAVITKFLLDTRVFQLTVQDIPSTRVYNRDQIPIALAALYSKTIDDTNKEVI